MFYPIYITKKMEEEDEDIVIVKITPYLNYVY
jgi:hypothetical protein